MTDAAAFFANKKKKKKKAFKFNANTIDASTITSTVHVEAPALSTTATDVPSTAGAFSSLSVGNTSQSADQGQGPYYNSSMPTNGENKNDDDGQWDDAALAAKTSRKGMAVAVPSGATTKELAETKAMSLKTHTTGNEEEDIAEKLRVEETKAQLAAAREGMEREAQRLKDEKEKKEQEVASTSSRFGAAAAGMSSSTAGSSGKWVPSRLRNGGGGGISAGAGWGSKMSSQKNVDTEDENLFPDLATAEAIIEKQKQEQPAYKVPTKTPVGGGASWGSYSSSAPATRPKLNLKKKTVKEPATGISTSSLEEESDTSTRDVDKTTAVSPITDEVKPEATIQEAADGGGGSATAADAASPQQDPAATVEVAIAPTPIKPKKKKKKKDISTFKK